MGEKPKKNTTHRVVFFFSFRLVLRLLFGGQSIRHLIHQRLHPQQLKQPQPSVVDETAREINRHHRTDHIQCKQHGRLLHRRGKSTGDGSSTHLLLLVPISSFFRGWLGLAGEGALGFWTAPVQIVLASICSFISVALVCVLLQRIPKVGKYIVG